VSKTANEIQSRLWLSFRKHILKMYSNNFIPPISYLTA
jgi:hypothetical protein